VYLSWEMFFNEKLTLNEKPTVVIKEIQEEVDWVNYKDVEAIKTMLKTSGDVFAITNEEPSDTSKFIMPIVGPINNWTWVGFSKNMGKEFCNSSSNVLLNIFNKMNFDLAYIGVFHSIEILHLSDSNKFENEINKQLENKIEPMEPNLETINLGNDENPRLIKIDSTLNEKERKDLQELFMEFQEVLHGLMKRPRIDPKIA